MKCVRNNDINLDAWQLILQQSLFSSPFQTPEFFSLFNSIKGYSAEAFAIQDGTKLLAVMIVTLQKEDGIKGFFSRRAIVYGGPLLLNISESSAALALLLKSILLYFKNKAIYCEIRNAFNYNLYSDIFTANNWNYNPHLNVQLDLHQQSIQTVTAAMKYNRRREINLSLKEGAAFREAESIKEIQDLYNNLSDLYTSRVKLPLPPLDYFIKLYQSPIGKVFIVLHNGKLIGGAFCIYYPNQAIYSLYYTGIRDYHKKIFPTHLAVLGAIEFGTQNNLTMLDFMGAGKPGIDYGVRKYKLEFGGNLAEHGRFIKVMNPVLFKVGKLGLRLLAK
jgi:serine/alanine adding enzyme